MHRLIVTEKSGFDINNPNRPVIIRDNRGILFYSTESLAPKVDCFNMPPLGTFWIESGSFVKREKPVDYTYADLPTLKKRHDQLTGKELPMPTDFKVVFGNNPNKCTVKWGEHVILIDNAFKEKPLNQVYFVLFHEYGHAFFEEETLCDQFAGNYMKLFGFNPSQIAEAPKVLSAKQEKRKKNMVNSLISAQ